MNTKRFFAAIFAAAILSISFLACDPKEDDPTTNPTPSTDVVKEVYGFYGKSEAQVLPLLDAKGWRKSVDTSSLGVVYTYLSIDSNKMYSVYSTNNVIYSVSYGEAEKTMMYNGKLASNTNRLLSLFEKWEQSLSTVNISNSTFQGSIIADEFEFVQDSANNKLIYSNNVSLRILYTDEKTPYIQIERTAKGKSFQDAKFRAEKIQYGIKVEGNHLYLDNYLLTDVKNKFRDQEVELYLYLPEGTLLKPDASVQNYDRSDNDFFNLHYSSDNYVYKVTDSQIKCLNCPDDEDEWNDVENDSTATNVTINENGISIKKDTLIKSNKDIKELKINKDGIIIKTE